MECYSYEGLCKDEFFEVDGKTPIPEKQRYEWQIILERQLESQKRFSLNEVKEEDWIQEYKLLRRVIDFYYPTESNKITPDKGV